MLVDVLSTVYIRAISSLLFSMVYVCFLIRSDVADEKVLYGVIYRATFYDIIYIGVMREWRVDIFIRIHIFAQC